jgi:S1-C subfamily serine protease
MEQTEMKRLVLITAILAIPLTTVWAESQYYLWTDKDGSKRITAAQPDIGIAYKTVRGPDPIHWYNAPEMPGESADSEAKFAQDVFQLASKSVYTLLGKNQGAGGQISYGSAVAITSHLAITNCHIVIGAGDDIFIGQAGAEGVEQAKLIGADFIGDRCVLSVYRMELQPVAGIRSFDAIQVGEQVYAVGNPRMLDKTLSEGVLSGKRINSGGRYLQTTAAISPGSSGGGLFDAHGNLLGITAFTMSNSQSLNFAIPAEDYWQ